MIFDSIACNRRGGEIVFHLPETSRADRAGGTVPGCRLRRKSELATMAKHSQAQPSRVENFASTGTFYIMV